MSLSSTPHRILIFADDLTGALDTSGFFSENNFRTMVVVQPPRKTFRPGDMVDVVVINTNSRHLMNREAGERVASCFLNIDWKPNVLFKKIDSTLRGNIAEETTSLLNVSDCRFAFVCPAFPDQGRTLVDSRLHVDGVPIGQSELAFDGIELAFKGSLLDLFRAKFGAEEVEKLNLAKNYNFFKKIIVADASSDLDIERSLNVVRRRRDEVMLVGSGGLGKAIASSQTEHSNRKITSLKKMDRILVVVGSRTKRSKEQVVFFKKHYRPRLIEAVDGVVELDGEFLKEQDVLIHAVKGNSKDAVSPRKVASLLAKNTVKILKKTSPDALVIVGGDTAYEILRELKVSFLITKGNLFSGIPFCEASLMGKYITIVTKSGGFGEKAALVNLAKLLTAKNIGS